MPALPQILRRPAAPASRGAQGNLEDMIAKAQHGRVNITPAKAIEMAGQLYTRGQHVQAERVCRQIIEARPANADAHNILGVTLAARGQSDEAVDDAHPRDQAGPPGTSFHANLGEVLRQAGRAAEAEAPLEQAVKLDPKNAQALNNLGIIRYEQKKFDEAVEFYRRALEVRPSMAEALNNLGNALRLTGDIDGADSGLSGGAHHS